MTEPFWKQLVEQLTDQGVDNPYVERLRERLTQAQRKVLNRGSLQQEIIEEMGYSLVRAEDKINAALAEATWLAESLDSPRQIKRYNDAVERAHRARWEYMVHREAIGLYDHRVLEELFPLPRKVELAEAS